MSVCFASLEYDSNWNSCSKSHAVILHSRTPDPSKQPTQKANAAKANLPKQPSTSQKSR